MQQLSAGPAQGLTVTAPLEIIQEVLNDQFPGNQFIENEFETSAVEFCDLSLAFDGSVSQLLSKLVQPLKPRKTFRPRLRTSCAPARQPTPRSAFVSLIKRNFGVAYLAAPTGYGDFGAVAVDKMMDVFCVDSWRQDLAAMEKVSHTENLVADWAAVQTPDKLDNLERTNLALTYEEVAQTIGDYEFILKNMPKVSDSIKPQTAIPAVQTVMFHSKKINSYFGPIVRELDARFRSLLRPNVLYNKGKNLPWIESFLQANYSAAFGSLNVENDFADYDRSQERVALACDISLLTRLGMREEDIKLWQTGHEAHVNMSFQLGMMIYLRYQRKSGDVTTAFGNTTFNMTCLAWSLDLRSEDVLCAMFLGDDSFMQLCEGRNLRGRVAACSREVALLFNAQAKTGYFDVGYFCGYYILVVDGEVKLAADPYRRATKLGRWDVKSDDEIKEHWISFKDVMRNYDDRHVQEALVDAVKERQPITNQPNVDGLVCSLNTLTKSYKQFRRMWEDDVSITYY